MHIAFLFLSKTFKKDLEAFLSFWFVLSGLLNPSVLLKMQWQQI
jgi:hypothetical protein